MIYNKPRDFSWKVLPSLSVSKNEKPKKVKNTSTTDNLIKHTSTEDLPVQKKNNVDIILSGKPEFVKELELDENTIIDLTTMPIIEGIPILQFPDEPYKEPEKQKTISAPPFVETQESKKLKADKQKKVKVQKTTKASHKLKIASFFLMLYFGTVVSFIIPLRPTYSETEKRNLKEFPTFSIEALTSGDYFSDISAWFSDTFPFRERLTEINTKIEDLYGFNNVVIHGDIEQGDDIPDLPAAEETQADTTLPESTTPQTTSPPTTTPPTTLPPTTTPPTSSPSVTDADKPDFSTQNIGAIIVAGDSGYEYYSFSKDLAPRYIDSISKLNEKAKPSNNVFALVVPTSIDITLNDALRAEVNSADQQKALAYLNNSIKNAITVDSIFNAERLHRNEYIYFRTDHHWTALGAYYAYEEFCKTKGIAPIPLSDYQSVAYENFTGTFYTSAGQNSTLKENADQVITYTPFNNHTCTITEEDGSEYQWDIVKDVNDYGSTLKYLTFIGGDNPLTTIVNHDNPNGETCIVIKDSYGNAFVPFLLPHYSTIYVIDPRHFDSTLESFAQDKVINDVIFISNISTTRNKVFIGAMEDLVK